MGNQITDVFRPGSPNIGIAIANKDTSDHTIGRVSLFGLRR